MGFATRNQQSSIIQHNKMVSVIIKIRRIEPTLKDAQTFFVQATECNVVYVYVFYYEMLTFVRTDERSRKLSNAPAVCSILT
jgi:hypothetical protein